MNDHIVTCIKNFRAAPREFPFWDRFTYLKVRKPIWIYFDRSDKLMTLFSNIDDLLKNGVVVWGHIIQANRVMFQNSSINAPGEVVYSIEDSNESVPETLEEVAHSLYALKGTQPANPEMLAIAYYLTDERVRAFGLPVPEQISPKLRCRISTTFFVRKHLPRRRLCKGLFPLIVSTVAPHVAIPLPERYWPLELKRWWRS